MPDNLIVKAHVPEMYLRELGFDHESKDLETIYDGPFKRQYKDRQVLEFRVDGYLGWWTYYRVNRTIVLNITDSNYQGHTTYITRNEIIEYLKKEDEFRELHKNDPNISVGKGPGWVKRYKLDEILKICTGDE